MSSPHSASDSDSSTPSSYGPACVVCKNYGGGSLLLQCQSCTVALHTFCCQKPLGGAQLKATNWRCSKCYIGNEEISNLLPRIRKYRKFKKQVSTGNHVATQTVFTDTS
eukprot:TRINITY_DN50167_c0_g1_i1.p1 TRINITY_DN50167_c0_g1~~TRINITY_DN50167_c0_g1_i1.p1  ORF type:complete len:109 (+),score=1.04 TRINITY_DN50167_c0_g1_i1:46-372(+)